MNLQSQLFCSKVAWSLDQIPSLVEWTGIQGSNSIYIFLCCNKVRVTTVVSSDIARPKKGRRKGPGLCLCLIAAEFQRHHWWPILVCTLVMLNGCYKIDAVILDFLRSGNNTKYIETYCKGDIELTCLDTKQERGPIWVKSPTLLTCDTMASRTSPLKGRNTIACVRVCECMRQKSGIWWAGLD